MQYPSSTPNLDKLSFEYFIQNPHDSQSFHFYLNHIWNYWDDNDPLELYFDYISKRHKLNKINKDKKFVFITIQDFQRRITDLEKLKQFLNKIEYIFEECHYCVESGKVPLPDSNLHIHLLAKYRNSKKGKNQLCIEWSKLFNTDLRDKDFFQLRQHRNSPDMPKYEDWIQEKLDYFDQEKKGNHENVIDLDVRGSWGAAPGA